MRPLLLLVLLLPIAVVAQKIKVNGYDKFIKKKVIETSFVPLKSNLKMGMYASLKSVGNVFFVSLKGYGAGASTIGADDQAIFLLDNDSTVTVRSTGIQTYELGSGLGSYNHEYSILLDGLELLSQHNLKSVRKYGVKGYIDVDVPEKYESELAKLSVLFLNELKKEKVIYYAPAIALEDVARHVGDSVMVCGKIFTSRYLPNANNKPTLMNMGAAYPNQLLTVVIYEQDRNNFDAGPEDFYRDKTICVRGRIELYNGKPQIIVHRKSQITVQAGEKKTL